MGQSQAGVGRCNQVRPGSARISQREHDFAFMQLPLTPSHFGSLSSGQTASPAVLSELLQCELDRFTAQRTPFGSLLAARAVHNLAPRRDTVCGLADALSVTERVPDPEPFCSSHVTDIVQNCPGFRLVPQSFPSRNGPVIVIPLIFKV